MNLRRKLALLVALIIIVSIPISYFLWSMYVRLYGVNIYEKTINRKPTSLQEAFALDVAEYSNYSHIFGKPNFASIWADFIDAKVIQYYNDRYDNFTQKDWDKPRQIRFRYDANVSTWNQIHVVYVPTPEDHYNSKIQVQSINCSILLENVGYMEYAHWNGSDHQKINASEIDFFIPKSYVVRMELEYFEYYGPLAASYLEINQLVIVDENLVAVLLGIESSKALA